ncbi:MAG: hypothetical protein GF355_02535, partial [Candidatus Eisenbacteria bacterium]|nr:hypothetical protein [Candidatus Eisenbacteria bacterium]
MKVRSFLLSLVIAAPMAFLGYGCLGQDDESVTEPDPDSGPVVDDYEASGSVTTTSEGAISTGSGAGLYVPRYAVPHMEDGSAGTMVFSIERNQAASPPLVQGKTLASEVYRFGPDGFTFGEMLRLTVPVTGDVSGKLLRLYAINETTGQPEPRGGVYSEDDGTVTGQTYHLSSWFVAASDPTSTAWGAFHVTNESTTHWLNLCVTGYDLEFPDADGDFADESVQAAWAPVGDPGWDNSGLWYLPQGTYDLCVSMREAGTIDDPPGDPRHWYLNDVSLDEPWTRSNPSVVEITYALPPTNAENGECGCVPQSTTAVGTGDIQVTLTWHSQSPVDLDLFVTDPDGDVCCFLNPRTPSGGRLDRDNWCGAYINGRPENIFWDNAPLGAYKVQVGLYSMCSSNLTSMDFTVRVVCGGSVTTHSGAVSAGEPMVDVVTFNMTSPVTQGSRGQVLVDG